jgi:hypothetical protein
MPCNLLLALFDPAAPVASCLPTGALGAFLVFLLPLAGSIPIGVLMAHEASVPVFGIVVLYVLSDIVTAFVVEPLIRMGPRLGRRYESLRLIGQSVASLETQVGLGAKSVRGRLGLIFLAFCASPSSGRVAAALAGHGPVSGWTLAIIGDTLCFIVLLISTLWLSDLLGDPRLVVGIVFVGGLLLPIAFRSVRLRQRDKAQEPAS